MRKFRACFIAFLQGAEGLIGLCQGSSVKLRQVNVPAVVGMGTLVQLVTTIRHVVEPERVHLMHMSVMLLSNCL